MDPSEFQALVKRRGAELSQYLHRKLPVKAGAKVKSIVQQNFRLGGFQDGALIPWEKTKRQSSGTGADSRRGPLLSSRKVLYSGTTYTPGDACVTIHNDVIYAGIHNEGGITHPKVTAKMRRYAWARYYEATGGKKGKGKKGKTGAAESEDASFWKGIALTKKQTLNVRIPKRQFIGPSKTIDAALQTMIEQDLKNILTK